MSSEHTEKILNDSNELHKIVLELLRRSEYSAKPHDRLQQAMDILKEARLAVAREHERIKDSTDPEDLILKEQLKEQSKKLQQTAVDISEQIIHKAPKLPQHDPLQEQTLSEVRQAPAAPKNEPQVGDRVEYLMKQAASTPKNDLSTPYAHEAYRIKQIANYIKEKSKKYDNDPAVAWAAAKKEYNMTTEDIVKVTQELKKGLPKPTKTVLVKSQFPEIPNQEPGDDSPPTPRPRK